MVRRMPGHLKLPGEVPAPRAARAPPLSAGGPTRLVGRRRRRVSTPVPERRPTVGPEACPVARSDAPNEALRVRA